LKKSTKFIIFSIVLLLNFSRRKTWPLSSATMFSNIVMMPAKTQRLLYLKGSTFYNYCEQRKAILRVQCYVITKKIVNRGMSYKLKTDLVVSGICTKADRCKLFQETLHFYKEKNITKVYNVGKFL